MKIIYKLLSLSLLYFIKESGVNAMSGRAFFYNDQGYGVCGDMINAKSDLLVAVPASYFKGQDPNSDPVCRSHVRVNFNGKTITVPVKDRCMHCSNNKIELSESAYIQLVGGTESGELDVTWEFVEGGISNSGGGSSSGSIGSSGSSSSSSGTIGGTCSKTASVDAGQGCWDVWTSKCGNSWNENQFYASNPGVVCTALKIGQQLCCGGNSRSNNGGGSSSGGSGSSSGTCSRTASVDAGQGCWDVWTSKCGNAWNENQFYASNPGVICTALKIGQKLCCGGGSLNNSGTSPSSSGSGSSCSKKVRVDAGQGCWDVWTSKCGNAWNENQFYRTNPGVGCTTLKIGQELCCN